MRSDAYMRLLARALSPGGARGRLLVFCFHRVLARKDAIRNSEPDVTEFSRDMHIIRNNFSVLRLGEAVDRQASGDLPPAAACVTFDDGYADNHEFAAPILEQAGIPATFFIASGAVDTGAMWNDLIIDTIAKCGDGARFDVLPVPADANCLAGDPAGGAGKLLASLKYLPVGERMEAATTFYTSSTGHEVPRLMMTREQIADLSRRGFDMGGHTLTHPILTGLDDDRARSEIEGCRDWLAHVTGVRPETFAYPNGIPGKDFTPRHENLVREAGFKGAVSTRWAAVRGDDDPYRIPRVGPWWRLGFGLVTGLARVYASSYMR